MSSQPGEPLSPILRALVACLGAAALIAGSVAVLFTDNEVGSGVLVATGLFLTFVGLVGHFPSRVRLGDNEIEWALREAARARADGDEERSEALVATATEAAERASVMTGSAAQAALQYETAALVALTAAMPDGASLATPTDPGGGLVDALVTANGVTVGVEFRSGTRFSPRDLVGRLLFATTQPAIEVNAFLIIMNAESTNPAIPRLAAELRRLGRPALVASWRPGEPVVGIAGLLNALIESGTESA